MQGGCAKRKSRQSDAQHIAHGTNLGCIALIFDKTKFHLGASEKMRRFIQNLPLHTRAPILAPEAGVFSGQIRTGGRAASKG